MEVMQQVTTILSILSHLTLLLHLLSGHLPVFCAGNKGHGERRGNLLAWLAGQAAVQEEMEVSK